MSQRRRRNHNASQATQSMDIDDDEDFTQSQRTQGKGLSPEEENQLVGNVIKYLLALNRKKHVIQRQHLIKNVFDNYAKYYRKVMVTVKEKLKEVFGIELIEIETNKYILINAIPNNTPHLLCPTDEQPRRILLVLVLSNIFMSDNKCKEELLWDFLRKLTLISEDNFHNEYFGDIRKLITVDFVKEQYLYMNKIGSSESTSFEFEWGPRAEAEVSKRQILEFVSKMYNRPIETWTKQLHALSASE